MTPVLGPAEAVLVEALRQVGVDHSPGRHLSFFQLNGQAERVPALRALVRQAGWEPPPWDALISTTPLHKLAQRMVPARGDNASRRWRQLMPDALSAAVDRLQISLEDGAGARNALWVTGSWIEGLANTRSDVDVYVITEGRGGGAGEFLAEEATYLDVETWSVAALSAVGERVAAAVAGQIPLASLALSDIDLYYRASIAARISDGDVDTSGLTFDQSTAAVALRDWSRLAAAAAVARAKIVAAEGFEDASNIFYRHAGWLTATAILAEDGEAYPSLKWALEKARRRYGEGSVAFADIELLMGTDPAHKGYRRHLKDRLALLPDDAVYVAPDSPAGSTARFVTVGGRSWVTDGRTKLRPIIPGLETAVGLVLEADFAAADALRARYPDLSNHEAASLAAWTAAEIS